MFHEYAFVAGIGVLDEDSPLLDISGHVPDSLLFERC
jgi:hypothetical protein